MRILVYGINDSVFGGIETFFKNMDQYMSEKIIFDYVVEGNSSIYEKNINTLRGNIYYIAKRNMQPFKNILDVFRLFSGLRENTDAVYFNMSSLSWIFPILIARILNYKVFVHSHNSQLNYQTNNVFYRIVNLLNKEILSHMCIKRLTCSKKATDFMFKSSDSIQMVFNAINVSQFAFNESIREKVRNELGIKDNYVIGFVGRLSDQKNPLFFPDIMNALLSKFNNAVMLIVGDGPLKKQLEEKIVSFDLTDKCRLLGIRSDVQDLLQAMDVFVLPSKYEGLPFVLVEAQTSGLKCVVSDAVTEEVDVAGIIKFIPISFGADIWAEALIECINQPVLDRKAMAAFIATTPFNIDNEAKRFEYFLSCNC